MLGSDSETHAQSEVRESNEAPVLEDADFRVERTSAWRLRIDSDGVLYYEALTGDIWEIAEGPFA